jgi:hypothetical protein
MTGRGDIGTPKRVREAAAAEGLVLAGCPTRCDPGCEALCHEVHHRPSRRWHVPGWSCLEVQLLIARAVSEARETIILLAEKKRAVYCRPCDGGPCDYTDELAPFADLLREAPGVVQLV